MIRFPLFSVLLSVMLSCNLLSAQKELKLTAKDSVSSSLWIFGLGFNFVDDTGQSKPFGNFDELNAVAFPSRVSVGRYFESGFGIELIGTYNVYKVGTLIDKQRNLTETDYFGIDSRVSYDLNNLVGETGWFDPYIGVGLGYTDANNVGRATFNAGLGFRTWISDNWGLDFNGSGKWNLGNEGSNHVQYGAGVVYRSGREARLTRKGREKLVELERINRDRERKVDSVTKVNREKERVAEEARKREVEAKLAEEIRQAKLTERENYEKEVARIVESLGTVYFEFNSSQVTDELKDRLDAMAVVMMEDPSVIIEIIAYTDSRGDSEYNMWLSSKRAVNAKEYLINKGISPARITSKGGGETNMVNKCSDNVPCTKEEHSKNRRTEVKLTFGN